MKLQYIELRILETYDSDKKYTLCDSGLEKTHRGSVNEWRQAKHHVQHVLMEQVMKYVEIMF